MFAFSTSWGFASGWGAGSRKLGIVEDSGGIASVVGCSPEAAIASGWGADSRKLGIVGASGGIALVTGRSTGASAGPAADTS